MSPASNQTANEVEMEVTNSASTDGRVIYRGESGYSRQMETQIIELNPPRTTSNANNARPSDPVNLNSINSDTLLTSNSTVSPRSYDPEFNLATQRDGASFGSRWITQTASRLSHTLDLSNNLAGPGQHNSGGQLFVIRHYAFFKDYRFHSSLAFRKNLRRVFVTLVFALVVCIAYYFSVRFVDFIDRRVGGNLHVVSSHLQGSRKNAVNNQDLTTVIDELRMEIQKLKEISYKNSVAISGLSNGDYKVPGATDDSENVKRNKFGKGGSSVNLKSNTHRQDFKSGKRRLETSDFVPGTIEYDASITLQS